jgi:hypothetical protein
VSLTLTLEFSDRDLDYFRKILAREQERCADLDTETIISSREDWYRARKHEIFERMRNRLERRQRTPGTSGKLTSFSLS